MSGEADCLGFLVGKLLRKMEGRNFQPYLLPSDDFHAQLLPIPSDKVPDKFLLSHKTVTPSPTQGDCRNHPCAALFHNSMSCDVGIKSCIQVKLEKSHCTLKTLIPLKVLLIFTLQLIFLQTKPIVFFCTPPLTRKASKLSPDRSFSELHKHIKPEMYPCPLQHLGCEWVYHQALNVFFVSIQKNAWLVPPDIFHFPLQAGFRIYQASSCFSNWILCPLEMHSNILLRTMLPDRTHLV